MAPQSTIGASAMTDPVLYPEGATSGQRNKRAFLLLLMTLIMPGSAQIVAGNRALGRRALRVTLTAWAVVAVAILLALVNRSLLVNIVTHRWWSLVIIAALVFLAIGWAIMFINTLRIIQPRLLEPRLRAVVAGLMAVLMLATSGSLSYGAYVLNVGRATLGSIFQAGPAFDPVEGRYNFLLMGGDAGEDRLGRRPDSISVVSIDAESGQTVIFSIPRNLQNAPFPADSPLTSVWPDGYNCGDECIINSLYPTVVRDHADLYPDAADTGAEAMMDAATGVLGIEIQAYVIVDMAGFEELVDAMGGITVTAGGWVPVTSGEIPGTYPIRHYPPSEWIAPGRQTLDGYHALWYARSREFVTDYNRIQRQQCVQAAMIAQLDPATVLSRFEAIASAGTQIVETDIAREQLGSFVDLAVKAKDHEVQRMTIGPPDFGTPQDNFVTYPDFDEIHSRVQEKLTSSTEPQSLPTGGEAPSLTRAAVVERVSFPTADEDLTEEYLQQLAINGDFATLGTLLADNGECTPG